MARDKCFYVLNAVVLLLALTYAVWAGIQARNYISRNVLCIMPVMNDENYFFNADDLETVTNAGFEGMVATERLTRVAVTTGEISANARLITTGRDYFNMQPMSFISGGLWTADHETERVIVLSESLAWMLFGDTHAVGQRVRIAYEEYRVTGVVGQGRFSKDSSYAWMPPAAGDEIKAGTLYLKPSRYNRLDAYLAARTLLESMRRRVEDYVITDMNAYADSIAQRGQFLFFLGGLYFIFLIGLLSYRLARATVWRKKGWLALSVCVIADIAVIILLTRTLSIDLWVPAYMGEGLTGYARAFLNQELLLPVPYLSYNLASLSAINEKATAALIAGLVALMQCVFFTPSFKE